jgi:hypothetical protein
MKDEGRENFAFSILEETATREDGLRRESEIIRQQIDKGETVLNDPDTTYGWHQFLTPDEAAMIAEADSDIAGLHRQVDTRRNDISKIRRKCVQRARNAILKQERAAR